MSISPTCLGLPRFPHLSIPTKPRPRTCALEARGDRVLCGKPVSCVGRRRLQRGLLRMGRTARRADAAGRRRSRRPGSTTRRRSELDAWALSLGRSRSDLKALGHARGAAERHRQIQLRQQHPQGHAPCRRLRRARGPTGTACRAGPCRRRGSARLHDVGAAADPSVEQHSELAAGLVGDLRQRVERSPPLHRPGCRRDWRRSRRPSPPRGRRRASSRCSTPFQDDREVGDPAQPGEVVPPNDLVDDRDPVPHGLPARPPRVGRRAASGRPGR